MSEQSDHVYYLVATFNRGLRTRKVKRKKKHSVGQGFSSTLALLRVTKFFVVRVCSVRGRTFSSISGYYPVDASGSPTLIPQLWPPDSAQVPWGQNCPRLRTTGLGRPFINCWSQASTSSPCPPLTEWLVSAAQWERGVKVESWGSTLLSEGEWHWSGRPSEKSS